MKPRSKKVLFNKIQIGYKRKRLFNKAWFQIERKTLSDKTWLQTEREVYLVKLSEKIFI